MSNFSIFLAFEGDTKKFSLQLSRPKAWTFEASAFGSTAKAIKLTWRCLEGKAWPWGLHHCVMHLLNWAYDVCCSVSRCRTSADQADFRSMHGRRSGRVQMWSEFVRVTRNILRTAARRLRTYCRSALCWTTKTFIAACQNMDLGSASTFLQSYIVTLPISILFLMDFLSANC